MAFSWRAVPESVLVPLLQGCTGRRQLHHLAKTALGLPPEAAQASFPQADFVRETLLCAWEDAPLDLNCVNPLLELQDCLPCLPAPLLRLLEDIKRGQSVPEDLGHLRSLARTHDDRGMLDAVAAGCRREPGNGYRVQQAVRLGSARDLAWLEERLAEARDVPAPVLDVLKADAALLRGDLARAVRHFMAALRVLPLPAWRIRLGESLLRAGQTDEALHHWDAALAARPWLTHLFLRRDDLRRGLHLPGNLPPGRGVILLYSWNKAALLNTTLASLHASDIGEDEIIALDNGSTDGTPELLDIWTERFGPRFSVVRLPCNIGAPAARNWLLSLPPTQSCDRIVFLDDDINLPADWLRRFGAAMAAYPGHGVFGCRVVDHDRPHMIQCADLHLTPGDDPNAQGEAVSGYEQRFAVSTLHIDAAEDFGQFSYTRPCASVTGCCHLFRRKALSAVGLFDVRYSPSQFDDFEHDLRHVMRGDIPVYQGHLRIPHFRRTGSCRADDEPQLANSSANMHKLQMRYSREQFDAIRAAEHAALLGDMLDRADEEERRKGC